MLLFRLLLLHPRALLPHRPHHQAPRRLPQHRIPQHHPPHRAAAGPRGSSAAPLATRRAAKAHVHAPAVPATSSAHPPKASTNAKAPHQLPPRQPSPWSSPFQAAARTASAPAATAWMAPTRRLLTHATKSTHQHQRRDRRHRRPLRQRQHQLVFPPAQQLERPFSARLPVRLHAVVSSLVSRPPAVSMRSSVPLRPHGLKAASAHALAQLLQHHLLHQHHPSLRLPALQRDSQISANRRVNPHAVGSNQVSRQLAALSRSTAPLHQHGLKAASAIVKSGHSHAVGAFY